uniref:Uncharacterized protein n=1 Tax=Ananas comosus var. bracteatus TaxID=296719 RepID=A0A6V7P0D1_ANACO|nr:unnamed protein product [Ananas comosus var. bracteatus]
MAEPFELKRRALTEEPRGAPRRNGEGEVGDLGVSISQQRRNCKSCIKFGFVFSFPLSRKEMYMGLCSTMKSEFLKEIKEKNLKEPPNPWITKGGRGGAHDPILCVDRYFCDLPVAFGVNWSREEIAFTLCFLDCFGSLRREGEQIKELDLSLASP